MRLFDLSHVVRANAVAAIACALSAVPVRADPPKSGEHTRAILAGLGYTTGQIVDLIEKAAVA